MCGLRAGLTSNPGRAEPVIKKTVVCHSVTVQYILYMIRPFCLLTCDGHDDAAQFTKGDTALDCALWLGCTPTYEVDRTDTVTQRAGQLSALWSLDGLRQD